MYYLYYIISLTRPFPNDVNPIDIGIDITDVLRINDKVSKIINPILIFVISGK